MDLVTMLRNYAGMGKTGAIERMLMNEAADRLERKDKLDIPLNQKLKEDRANAYNAMCRIGANNEIWQDETVYNLAKGQYDIIEKINAMEKLMKEIMDKLIKKEDK